MIPVSQTLYCRMVRILIEGELDGKEADVAPRRHSVLSGLTAKNCNQDSRCPDRNYNRAHSEYNSGQPPSSRLQSFFSAG